MSGVVYADLNRNSVRDAGEPGIGGVTVTLGGGSSATTTSAADGSYSFASLMAGDYTVSAPATAAGRALGTPSPLSVSLPAGVSSPNHDFGYVWGSVSGTVFSDTNGNGTQDAGEPGTPGVVVTLSGPNGTTTTTTDTNGAYTFPDLPAGDYTVTVPPIVGGEATTTPTTTVTVTPGQPVTSEDFGYEGGSVSGTVFSDTNGNGVQDAGEPGTAGVVVTLGGPVSATTTTNATGAYTFPDLPAGTYTVSVPPTVGGEAIAISTTSVTVTPGQTVTGGIFGHLSGGLSGFAYVDANRNSSKDSGEAGIGSVVITLAGGSTTTTAADGSYAFTNLDAGTYSVSAPATAAGKQRFTMSPLSVPLAAGQTQPNVNFGYVPGSLSGFAYLDANHNGSKDGGEAGIGAVVITLAGGGTMTTAADGSYAFSNLDAATCSVSAPPIASGYSRSTPSPLSVPLAEGQTQANVNFGYVGVTITGSVFTDTNNNGVRDAGEPGVSGVTVTLTGTSSGTTVTDTNGTFTFTNLPQGTNYVTVPPPGTGSASVTTVTVTAGQTPGSINVGYPGVTQNPGLSLAKSANLTTYSAAGQVIVYTYVLQNTGNVALTGPFTVTDNKLGIFQCGTATSLAAGASLTCTRSYTIQASDLGIVPSLPTGVVANVNTGAWLQGLISTQDTTITNAGLGVPDGIYAGWCIQDHVNVDLHNQPGTLYSTIGGSLPADVANLAWGKVNYC